MRDVLNILKNDIKGMYLNDLDDPANWGIVNRPGGLAMLIIDAGY